MSPRLPIFTGDLYQMVPAYPFAGLPTVFAGLPTVFCGPPRKMVLRNVQNVPFAGLPTEFAQAASQLGPTEYAYYRYAVLHAKGNAQSNGNPWPPRTGRKKEALFLSNRTAPSRAENMIRTRVKGEREREREREPEGEIYIYIYMFL